LRAGRAESLGLPLCVGTDKKGLDAGATMATVRIVPSRCPLVIAGAWNRAIFTPGFVSKHLFPGPDEPSAQMSVGLGDAVLRFSGGRFSLGVQSDRLVWWPAGTETENLAAVEQSAASLLDLLPLTPVTAVGFNYGFNVADPPQLLASVLNLPDADQLAETGGIRAVSIKRSLDLRERQLNAVISREGGGPVMIDLNFHRDVTNAAEARKCLDGSMLTLKEFSLDWLRKLYGLEVE
jgi:hypothetical protein